MSLTSHLEDKTSPIGQFIRQHFSQTSVLTKDVNRQLKNASTLRPVVQAGEQYSYGSLGAAIDYRIRYAFAITPYHKLVAWKGALKLTLKPIESDRDIFVNEDELFDVLALTPIAFDITQGAAQGPYPLQLAQAFFESLDAILHDIQPVGRRLDLEAERKLDRYCYVLNLFEQVFRSNAYVRGPLMLPTVKHCVEELLAIPQAVELDDMGALFALFYDRYHDLLSSPHVLNPTFAGSLDIGGADADFIVDGCLIDMKATISSQIRADFLYQLAGYLLLDYGDTYHITSVGIYMVRQGLLFTWPVTEFLQKLTGEDHPSLVSLRKEFKYVCQGDKPRR